MNNNKLYLPQILDFSFCRLNPIIYLKWKAHNIYYFNNCSLFTNIFDSDNHFKIGRTSEEDWLEFWHCLEQIDVWNWDSEYNYRGVKFYEASHWHLYISYQKQIIESAGNNSFPPTALNRPTDSFIDLLNAIIKLGNSII
jgi:hypothetical protein